MDDIENLTDEERRSLINDRVASQDVLIADIDNVLKKYRILSTLPYHKVDFWMRNLSTVDRNPGLRESVRYLFELLRRNRDYDAVLLAGGERIDLLYLAIAGLLSAHKTPHIVVDAHWQRSKGAAHLLQRIMLRLGGRVAVEFQPHSEEERELYNRNFGIPKDKLKAIPWSSSVIGYDFTPRKGDFILTGGASFRDYKTFLSAVRGLDLPVEIGLPRQYSPALEDFWKGSANIAVHNTLTNAEFYQKMAACRIFALPTEPKLERCTGDQTMLNAMYYGKIVVVTDSIASRIYVKDGVNGFLVPEADPLSWKRVLERVYKMDDREYSAIGARAEYDAKVVYNEKMRLYRTLRSVVDVLDERGKSRLS